MDYNTRRPRPTETDHLSATRPRVSCLCSLLLPSTIMLSTCIVYSPCVGDIYPSFDEAWYKLCTFSHRSRGSLRTQRRDTSCLHLVCIDRRCNFEAFVSFARQKDSPIKTYHLKRLLPIHICSGAEHTPRGSMHNIKFIRRTVSV